MGAIEFVVFDFDGTLQDSEARIVAAMQAACRDCGHPVPTAAAVREVMGLELGIACSALLAGEAMRDSGAVALAYRRHYAASGRLPAPLFDGARELLDMLAANPLLLGIATGKGRRGLAEALAEHRIGHFFAATRTADECPSKPHPAMLLEMIDELDVAAARAVMVGDSIHDLAMAHAAGIRAIAITHGAHSRARLLDSRPAALIDHLSELPGVLASLGQPALPSEA